MGTKSYDSKARQMRGNVKPYILPALLTLSLALSFRCEAQPPVAQPSAGGLFLNPALKAEKAATPVGTPFPLAPGWPLALPGSVTGTPVVADIDADDIQEIIVPCMQFMQGKMRMSNSAPSTDAQLWAFKADGRVVKNWPIVLVPTAERELGKKSNPQSFDEWYSSPSVVPDNNGDSIVLNVPDAGDWRRRVWHINGKSGATKLSTHSDPWATMPLADINGDAVLDVIAGRVLASVEGQGVHGWPQERAVPGGFAPAIADTDLDGKLEVYHPDYAMSYHEKPPKPQGTISGFDHTGKPLAGWPIKVADSALYVVAGDVSGDEKLEVCSVDAQGRILLWTWDGKPAPGTRSADGWDAVFKTDFSNRYAPLTLADLNGDGKAEIIAFDMTREALLAWKGNGEGLFDETGILCRLPEVRAFLDAGVTVADLGGDGVMDLFCGTFWIKLARDGKTEIKPLLPHPGAINSHVTICDIEGDGEAELLFGLINGRVYLFKTRMSIKPEWMQWPTQSGNFQHTGAWQNPRRLLR